jgi:hypothetical protein
LGSFSRLYKANEAILGSYFMSKLLFYYHWILELDGKSEYSTRFNAWDSIFPKGKDSLPSFNSSGKYAVKLFWLGAWRKVLVDDRIPIDANGKPLIVVGPTQNELWPAILTKAVIKIAASRYHLFAVLVFKLSQCD